MTQKDKVCSVAPYFKVQDGQMDEFKALTKQCVDAASTEEGCLYYGFSFNGEVVHCREGYRDADAILAHVANIDEPLQKMLTISDLYQMEIHGPESELAKLKKPLAAMNVEFFELRLGFRR